MLTDLAHHEHAPLTLTQRCSQVAAPIPLFTSLFNFRHAGILERLVPLETSHAWEGISLLSSATHYNFPITFAVDDWGEAFSFEVQAEAPMEPEKFSTYMTKALESLVTALESAPETSFDQLEVLPEAERGQVLFGFNASVADYPADHCVHQLFEYQAHLTPEALALVSSGDSLSFAQLNAQANRLAHHLRRLGAGPDVPVGIFAERSLGLVVALLAILKAGAAYLPLDPAYPAERIAFMLRDADAPVLLTQASLLPALPELSSTILCLDRDAQHWANLPDADLDPLATPSNLAYVIYTSGSTGSPKGILNTHRALVNRLTWAQRQFTCSPNERHAQKTAISFIDSLTETLTPLLAGAQLHIVPPDTARDPEQLADFIRNHRIARITLVPSLLAAILATRADALQNLKLIISSGEALPAPLAETVRRQLPSTRLIQPLWLHRSGWGRDLVRLPGGHRGAHPHRTSHQQHQHLPPATGRTAITHRGAGRTACGRGWGRPRLP